MEDILYINSTTDVRVKEMVEIIPSKDKELTNQIILTILSTGAGEVTPIFSKDALGTTMFTSIDEIGTKFILDGKEVISDDFLVVTKSQYGMNFNFFGVLFEDSNEHTLKISLINSKIPNFQRITFGPGYSANSITSVIISSSIVEIDSRAFSSCTDLTSITIPSSVTSIGDHAFENCTGLTLVIIPSTVNTIGDYAFNNCSSLTSITIPDLVTEIGNRAFYGCEGLTSVIIGNSVASIGDATLSYCSGLTNITSLATIAPVIQSSTFQNVKTNGKLHVPAGSDYSIWMRTSNYYLGKNNWTKVEDA